MKRKEKKMPKCKKCGNTGIIKTGNNDLPCDCPAGITVFSFNPAGVEGPVVNELLNELQQETEKLLALLTDRQPGLRSWNEFLGERLQKLHFLASDLGFDE